MQFVSESDDFNQDVNLHLCVWLWVSNKILDNNANHDDDHDYDHDYYYKHTYDYAHDYDYDNDYNNDHDHCQRVLDVVWWRGRTIAHDIVAGSSVI